MAVQQVLGGELAWVSEINPAACKVIAYRFPGVPNLGDITAVDWTRVEPVDVLTAGFPCQPVSHAGKRKGTDDDRWLFDDILNALGVLRPQPRLCLLENVPGLLTANRGDAMARVIQGLASVGLVGRYRLLRAADVGAPHKRERVFIAAHPADTPHIGHEGGGDARGRWAGPAHGHLLPTPTGRDHKGHNQRGDTTCLTGALLPTPTSMDGGGGYNGQTNVTLTDATVRQPERWGDVAAAVAHWEALTRPAPEPTMLSRKGNPQLSPRFVEWMQGLPDGWVTDVPGLSRNDMLRLLGNGVVPAQCAAALRWLLDMEEVA
jgi:DNA (cytosine-5)-methyltransferase 1